jgi:hypothetical protein
MISNTELGRAMMFEAGNRANDKECNDWARVGNLINSIGTSKGPKNINLLSAADKAIVQTAFSALREMGRI